MRYLYQRSGGPLITWSGRNSAPPQSRAADTVALGSLEGTSLSRPTLVLPAPGAPEPLNGISCKCGGTCGCSGSAAAMSGLPIVDDVVTAISPIVGPTVANVAAYGGLAYLAYKLLKRKKK